MIAYSFVGCTLNALPICCIAKATDFVGLIRIAVVTAGISRPSDIREHEVTT
jgi:hypothetical protein